MLKKSAEIRRNTPAIRRNTHANKPQANKPYGTQEQFSGIQGLCLRSGAVTLVDSVITYTLASLCELVNVRLVEAQANGFLCYKCKHIFGFY